MNCAIVSPEALDSAAPTPLSADETHHLRDVLRVRVGEKILLTDGAGRVREAVVAESSRRELVLGSFGEVRVLPRTPADMTLFACIAKPARMDWLLEKACELGARRIVPVLSARVVARQRPGERPGRWERIVESALRQCGGGWGTSLAPVAAWADAMTQAGALGGPLFVGSLAPGAVPLGDALAKRADAIAVGRPCGWLVGPEGDFSPEELDNALALPNAVPVTLGPRVLRVETAAVCGLSAILATALRA